MPKIPMFLYQDNLILVFRGCRCGRLAFTLSSERFLYENTPNVFFHSTSFLGKILPGLARLEIFSKSRLRLNLGYGKSRLTFADKTPGQGKRKAATPEKLKYLSPLKGGVKTGFDNRLPEFPTRNVPCPADECLRSSAGQGSFRVLLSGLCRSVKSQALLSGWLHRTNLSGNSLP